MMGLQNQVKKLAKTSYWIAGVLFWSSGVFIFSGSAHAESPSRYNSSWNNKPNWSTGNDSYYSDSTYSTPRRARVTREDSNNYAPKAPMSPGSNNLSLNVGQVFLMGDLATKYTDSIGTEMGYTYGVSDIFGYEANLGMSKHGENQFSMTTLTSGFRTNLTWYDKVIPYASLGLGFYKTSYQITNDYSVSPVLFGLHMGPGVDLVLSQRMFFGATLTFHDIFNSTRMTELGPKDVGGSFASFYLKVGVSL